MGTAPTGGRRSRVLLVDDSQDLLDAYVAFLRGTTAHEIRAAASGRAALEIARSWRPDILVTDVMMPDMNGLELITAIRSELPPPLPAIVAVSGFPDFELEAKRRGAHVFQAKPIDTEDLAALIDALLADRQPPEHVRARARRRRQSAGELGRAAVAATLARRPYFGGVAQLGARLLSRYFDDCQAAILMMQDPQLTVFASSSERWPIGTQPDGVAGYALDVVESGSTLIVPDLAALPAAASRPAPWRFLVALPLRTAEGITVGALVLAAPAPIPFDAHDLTILEHVVGRLGEIFSGADDARLLDGPGVLNAETWRQGLGSETQHLAYGHTLAIALGTLPGEPEPAIPVRSAPALQALGRDTAALLERLPPRTAVGRLGPDTLAAYTVAEDSEAGARALLALMASLETEPRGCVAVLSACGLVPADSGAALLDITRSLLDAARARGPATALTARLEPVAIARATSGH
jgi:CheY-like chemotaxis protein